MASKRQKERSFYEKLQSVLFLGRWEFRAEIEIPPGHIKKGLKVPDMAIYMRTFSHGGYTIEYESRKAGSAHFNSVVSKSASSVRFEVRDDNQGTIENFLHELKDSVINKDGTVNLPPEYLFKIKLYRPTSSGEERLAHEWNVSAEEVGSLDSDHSSVNEFLSFEVAFKKYRS
ncbi:hypothetical protein MHM93_14730 [Pseudoalteromonas sp. MM17-2]|uniref:hypothetical protein n=1 Tax=Pseudoalteromonas sp. MM17-2 TaxID=2917753 RepID=UPI001EF51CCE|nr:hypothetical protein [Pseudoalteromonas sp. MM17-2]MCG7545434.1 hypothetical protein [Pseudoalteromonas sp. MM17-2]